MAGARPTDGGREQLEGKLHERYGYTKDQVKTSRAWFR
jgi:uncharacterized protein YjbJ (UPF0337 family)